MRCFTAKSLYRVTVLLSLALQWLRLSYNPFFSMKADVRIAAGYFSFTAYSLYRVAALLSLALQWLRLSYK